MPTAVIVDAVRTAGGKRNGKLSGWHAADLMWRALSSGWPDSRFAAELTAHAERRTTP